LLRAGCVSLCTALIVDILGLNYFSRGWGAEDGGRTELAALRPARRDHLQAGRRAVRQVQQAQVEPVDVRDAF
jgi:hypothetical protein